MLWRWRNKLKWAPFEFFAPSPLLRVRSWLHPFKGHCEQQAMRDEGVIYVAGHPLLNRRCTRLPGCIRLLSDLYCVEWGVKLYSLTHSHPHQWLYIVCTVLLNFAETVVKFQPNLLFAGDKKPLCHFAFLLYCLKCHSDSLLVWESRILFI